MQPYILPFELALTRWAVVSHSWLEFGGDTPNITAFLAGWGTRCLGLTSRKIFRVSQTHLEKAGARPNVL